MAASAPSGMYVNMNSGAVQAGLMPFRNALINGDMRINQRGTSTNLASLTGVATASPGSWVADRWNVLRPAFAAGGVMGQGTNLTSVDLPFSEAGIKTFGRIGRLSGNTATGGIALHYNMESQDCYQYAGKTVTLSFYYRTGTNFSGSALSTDIVTGTGTDQAIRSGYTGSSAYATTNSTSTSWKRVSLTVTLSSSINQIGMQFYYTPVGTAGTNDYFDITGIQLELGSVPTSFEVRPYSVELQMCQRYCESIASNYGYVFGVGFWDASARILYVYKVQKYRICTIDTSNVNFTNNVNISSFAVVIAGIGYVPVTSIAQAWSSILAHQFSFTSSSSGSYGAGTVGIGQNPGALIIFSAEL